MAQTIRVEAISIMLDLVVVPTAAVTSSSSSPAMTSELPVSTDPVSPQPTIQPPQIKQSPSKPDSFLKRVVFPPPSKQKSRKRSPLAPLKTHSNNRVSKPSKPEIRSKPSKSNHYLRRSKKRRSAGQRIEVVGAEEIDVLFLRGRRLRVEVTSPRMSPIKIPDLPNDIAYNQLTGLHEASYMSNSLAIAAGGEDYNAFATHVARYNADSDASCIAAAAYANRTKTFAPPRTVPAAFNPVPRPSNATAPSSFTMTQQLSPPPTPRPSFKPCPRPANAAAPSSFNMIPLTRSPLKEELFFEETTSTPLPVITPLYDPLSKPESSGCRRWRDLYGRI